MHTPGASEQPPGTPSTRRHGQIASRVQDSKVAAADPPAHGRIAIGLARQLIISAFSPLNRRCLAVPCRCRPPSSSGLGHRPFTPAARVRIPLGVSRPHG